MDYLVVRTVDTTRKVHLSEVSVLLLESTAISITAYALCELMSRKVKVIFCDHLRNPCAELIPSNGCHDSPAKIRQQIRWTEGAKQLLWTEIIRAKITGQRNVLRHFGCPQESMLTGYLEQLQLNDVTNREGHAAKVYFDALFGMEFTRGSDCFINAALNYGYSLILSAVNREIAAAGYLTQLGIHHDNTFNAYNLGCDFMEPLRPFIDSIVTAMNPEKFEKEEKQILLGALNRTVRIDGRQQILTAAIRIYCASLFRVLQESDLGYLRLIEYEL